MILIRIFSRLLVGLSKVGFFLLFYSIFYINDLLETCLEKNIGACIGSVNTSIFGYCDDLNLLSPSISQMQRLLDTCSEYSCKWMLNFNFKKCKCIAFGDSLFDEFEFELCKQSLEIVEEIKLLGFVFKSPYFNENEFILEKFHSVRKAFYSLYSFGNET
jgi:hypothetical protein